MREDASSGACRYPPGGVKPGGRPPAEPPPAAPVPPAARPPPPPPPNSDATLTPLAVAVTDVAWTVPLLALVPCTTTVSPGCTAPALLAAVRVTLPPVATVTLTVVPSAPRT